MSDHNILSLGEKWIKVYDKDPGGWPPSMTKAKLNDVQNKFGPEWVITRINNDTLEMQLATLDKLKKKFERVNEFLLIQSEEISDEYDKIPIHINATNLLEFIAPQGGNSVFDVLQRNIDAVHDQREKTGQAMIAHINHPNYEWAILPVLTLGLSFLVSYSRARGEGLGIQTKDSGIVTRPERLLILIIGLITNQFIIAMMIVSLTSLISFIQRVRAISK